MKVSILFLAILLTASVAHGIDIPGGDIPYGTVWAETSESYHIQGDLNILGLTIEPGVEVLFDDDYSVYVAGVLTAVGTEADSIIFARAEINTVGWGGINFVQTYPVSELAYCEIRGATNSGVRIDDCSPLINNCLFVNNTASEGGGIKITLDAIAYADTVKLSDCMFSGNTSSSHAGGIRAILTTGSLALSDCIFQNNRASYYGHGGSYVGGAMYANMSSEMSVSIESCSFQGNQAYGYAPSYNSNNNARGGALYLHGGISTIVCSDFTNNLVYCWRGHSWAYAYTYGGGLYLTGDGSLEMTNCLVRDNYHTTVHGAYGDGVYVNSGTADITNCSILRNSTQGLYNGGGSVDIRNSILYYNGGDEIAGTVTVNYSDVEDMIFPGEGNILVVPTLDGSDTIQRPSQCINAGDPNSFYDDVCFPPSVPPIPGDPWEPMYRNDMGAHGGPGACGWLEEPPPPSNLTAQVAADQVLLNWEAVEDADVTHYLIFRSEEPIEDTYSTVLDSVEFGTETFIDVAAPIGTRHYYRLKSLNTALLESINFSNEVCATPGDIEEPAIPTGFAGIAEDAQISLEWNKNMECDLVSYQLSRGLQVDALAVIDTVLTGHGDQINYTDVDLINFTDYFYSLRAIDNAGLAGDSCTTIGPLTPLGASADLALTMSVDNTQPNLNDQIEFVLRVTNLGPDTAINVVATDTIPDGLTFVSSAASTGAYDDLSGQWLIGEMSTDQEDSLSIICTVSSFGQVVNSAWVEDEQEGGSTDVDPDNNTAEVIIEGHACDLALSMSLDNPTPNVGDEVQITIRLTNYGPDIATGVEVIAQRPAGLTYTDVDFTVGTYVGGIWRIGSQAVDQLDSLVITARVDLPTPIANMATAVHSNPPDILLSNNEAAVVIQGQSTELAISQTTDNYGPEVGEVVHFEVLVTNNGPSDATGIVVFDDIPDEFTVTNVIFPDGMTYIDSTWAIGDLAYQASATLEVTATVNTGGTIINTAYISTSDQSDSDPNNDTSFMVWSTDPADLKVVMMVDETSANVGDSLTFNVILENLGPSEGSGIQVMDKVPPGLVFLSAEVTQGTYDKGSGIWDVSALPAQQAVVLTLLVRVDLAATITNTASITRAYQADHEPGNNSDSQDVTGQEADLYITKTVDNAWPEVGEQITYIIQITNPGPSDVNYVSVLDTLPATGLTYGAITPTQGTYNDITGQWEIGTMPVGASETLTIMAEVTEAITIPNTAWIDSSNVPDPDPENSWARVVLHETFCDLLLAVHANDTQPELGSEFDYTIGLRNLGPDLASEIVVKDLLPEQVSWVEDAHSTSTGNYDPVNGIWDVGEVASQDSVWLTITVSADEAGVISNEAHVLSLRQTDPDWHNNNDHMDVTCVDVPPEIRIIEPPVATIAEALVVQAVVTDNTGITGVTLHYRQGDATEFSDTPMTAEDDSTYAGTIPADAVTVTGLSCYVSAEDIQGNTSESSPAAVSVAVPELAKPSPQPGGSEANAYRLFSVPLHLADTRAASVFEDDLGTYDPEKWRLFGLNAGESFTEFPDCGPVVAGAGFFLIVKTDGIYIDVGAGETVPMDQPFEINLHAGWNMVGNPFNVPISLDMLSLESSDPLNIQNYLGSWAEVVGTIQPFEGYLVSANASGDRLLVDPALAGGAPRIPAGPEALWSVRIEARAGEALDSQNFAEVHENAKVDWDDLDRPEPPVIGDYVSLYFPHPEWETPFAAFTKDSRPVPSESGGQHWDFKVRGNVSGSVSLGFEELASVPEAYEIWVRDELLCVNRDLRESNSYAYSYSGSGEPRAFRLVVGDAAYVAANLAAGETVPSVVTLGANFPNPFNPTTAIRFSLPQRETVDLRIYDVTGRLVRNLITGEQLDRGYHLEMWNGANDSGRRVASGVYFSRLTAGKEVRTQKMVLMK